MIGASMNCRGVGKKGMSAFLADLIRDQQLDFKKLSKKIFLLLFSGELTLEGILTGSGSVQLAEVGYPGWF
jgi:hypothetical protein